MAVPVSPSYQTPVSISTPTVYPFAQRTTDQLENKYFPWGSTSVSPKLYDAYNNISVVSGTTYPVAQRTTDQLEHRYIPLTTTSNAVLVKDNYNNINVVSGNSYVVQTTAVSGSFELSPKVTPVQIWKTGV